MDGMVVWCTGLPMAGKSSIARAACARLGQRAILLDEDELHAAISHAPPIEDPAFATTTARLAAWLATQGFIVVVAASARRRGDRELARELAPRFLEVHVAVPLGGGAGRESQRGYEPSVAPDIIARGGHDELALDRLVDRIERR